MNPSVAIPEHPSTGKGLWVSAATIAVTLHLGFAALAYVHLQQDARSDDLGAPGIEIGLELTSPRRPPTDLRPGPDSDAREAAREVREQVADVKEVDLPKDMPVETEDPDRQVTIETNAEPKDESPEVKVKNEAFEASDAQDAMAAPSLPNAIEAEKSVTIDQGAGESRQRVRVTWQNELLVHLNKHKQYPSDRNKTTVRIVLSLELDRMGRVVSVGVVESSGDEAFDEAARAMVKRASPVPPPPPLVADESLSFTLPVDFKARGKR